MKKFFMTMCAAFAMFAMVACGGNPAIDAAEAFIADPTVENAKAVVEAQKNLDEEQKAAYEAWEKENEKKIEEVVTNNPEAAAVLLAAALEAAAK